MTSGEALVLLARSAGKGFFSLLALRAARVFGMCFSKFCLALRFSITFGVFAVLLSLATGCGGGKGTVSGTVTLDGQPLPAGNIVFYPSKGPGVSGVIQDGTYSVKGVPTGQVTVTVETATIKQEIEALTTSTRSLGGMEMSAGGRVTPEMLAQMPEKAKQKYEEQKQQAAERTQRLRELQVKYREVPEKYSKPESSGLTTTVKSGSNTFEIQLSSK